jgi:hypothetical protein
MIWNSQIKKTRLPEALLVITQNTKYLIFAGCIRCKTAYYHRGRHKWPRENQCLASKRTHQIKYDDLFYTAIHKLRIDSHI